ncbi:MAG: anaerobic sulfatase maturase [Nitrospirae bacterium]|nr:anaerobic sulfatase maturase [Nitrospirota bacterium]
MSMPEHVMPRAFHIMAKPTGSACNLNCDYCFFLKKEGLYPGSNFRMADDVHEAYIRQLFEAHQVPQVTVAWQGGEPTLMGLDFFRRSIDLQKKYQKPGTRVENTFQTNGILINDEWCEFFRDNNFLIGLSMDGPKELHDFYRKDKGGNGTFDKVMKAARLLQKHKVEFNILCTVNSKNADYPLDVYRFFRDELKANYIQFIPIVERAESSPSPSPSPDRGEGNNTPLLSGEGNVSAPPSRGEDVSNYSPPSLKTPTLVRGGDEGEGVVTDRSVRPEQWGRFLSDIFDEWVKRDVGKTFILNFDGALAGWLGMAGTVCIFGQTCGEGTALEHNGDLYSCDHFVGPNNLLGNILQTPMIELVASAKQRKFGQDKRDTLPQYCLKCEFVHICNGECPKNRLIKTPDGEAGLNYLCEGYKAFFKHADKPMHIMATLLQQGRLAEEIMRLKELKVRGGENRKEEPGRNEPCFCGSGQKFKKCHGK